MRPECNKPFYAELKIHGTYSARNSTSVMWKDTLSDVKYVMTASELCKVLQANTIDRGVVSGRWVLKRKGPTRKLYSCEEE